MAEPYSQDLQGRQIATYAYEQFTISTTALLAGSTLGTAANFAGCKRLICTVESGAIRVRLDGTSPTAAVGTPYEIGAQFIIFGPDVQTLRAIRRDGADCKLSMEYAR